MDEKLIQKELKYFFCKLHWQPVELNRKWPNKFPDSAGVYILFHKSKPVYVGETGRISGRMRDLLNTKNHTIRRSIGKEQFSCCKGYEEASPKKNFPKHIEEKIDAIMREFLICAKPIKFGRKEIEEYILQQYCPKYNHRKKRK